MADRFRAIGRSYGTRAICRPGIGNTSGNRAMNYPSEWPPPSAGLVVGGFAGQWITRLNGLLRRPGWWWEVSLGCGVRLDAREAFRFGHIGCTRFRFQMSLVDSVMHRLVANVTDYSRDIGLADAESAITFLPAKYPPRGNSRVDETSGIALHPVDDGGHGHVGRNGNQHMNVVVGAVHGENGPRGIARTCRDGPMNSPPPRVGDGLLSVFRRPNDVDEDPGFAFSHVLYNGMSDANLTQNVEKTGFLRKLAYAMQVNSTPPHHENC